MDNGINEIFKTIGKRIAQKRQEKHLSQEQLAEAAKLHRNHIGYVERAEKEVTLSTLYKITKVLDMKLEQLFKEF